MKLSSIFKAKSVFSIEVFPPKPGMSVETVYETVEGLAGLKPDFVSVTYGAGGKSDNASPAHIASAVKSKFGIEPVAHLPCINMTKNEVLDQLAEFKEHGIDNILALRGDRIPGKEPETDFSYASDLATFIKKNGDFHIIGACYPEGHPEAGTLELDIDNLKRKVDAGVEHLITQLFFDNNVFYDFLEKIRRAGINVPVETGIMPITGKSQILRMVFLCGAGMPSAVTKMLQRYENDTESLKDAGIDYAARQISNLRQNGVDGIHLYTMNSPYTATQIEKKLGNGH